MEKTVTYSEVSKLKLEAPRLQYMGGNAGNLTVELFYDTYEYGTDVRNYTDTISDLIKIDTEIHAPPPLQFIWAVEKEPFIGVLESITKKFTMFLHDGTPVRARLSLKLKEFKMDLNKREKTLQSPDKTKVYITQLGDSLWLIASRFYGNAAFWRPIAERNGLKNPRILKPGTKLIIPPME